MSERTGHAPPAVVPGEVADRDDVWSAAMGLILSMLMLGLIASLSPATIVVFILVLGTAKARVNAAAFLIGWGASLTVVFTASYLIGSSTSTRRGGGATEVLVFEVLVGGVLLVTGVRRWQRRTEVTENTGRWGTQLLERTNDLGPLGAAVVGVLKQPWAITTAAAVVVAHHHAAGLLTLISFACFTVASTASVGLMFLYYTRRPGEAGAYLAQLRDRALASEPTMFAGAAILVGGFLMLDGLVSLRS
jgi:hypothetical protein